MGATQLKYAIRWWYLPGPHHRCRFTRRSRQRLRCRYLRQLRNGAPYRKEAIIKHQTQALQIDRGEHGFMFDCEISELMEEKGAYITTNLTAFNLNLLEIPAVKNVASSRLAKAKSASAAFKIITSRI
ncbi:hypothetical protein OH492_14640 [Vibrio chagasii]|nr:hypothetical protein [Vibrio chagasii]